MTTNFLVHTDGRCIAMKYRVAIYASGPRLESVEHVRAADSSWVRDTQEEAIRVAISNAQGEADHYEHLMDKQWELVAQLKRLLREATK